MRALSAWLVTLGCLLILSPAPVRAEDKKIEEYEVEDLHHKMSRVKVSNKEERDQLFDKLSKGEVASVQAVKVVNPLDIKWDLGLWTIIVFVILLFILSKAAWKPMLDGLQKREENIRAAVDEAKLARDETARMQADFKAKMAEAQAQIPALMEEARRDAEALKEELRSQANKEIQTERQRLRREIETAKDQALQEIWTLAAQLSTKVSEKVLFKILTPADHDRLFHLAMDELKGTGDRYREEFLKQ